MKLSLNASLIFTIGANATGLQRASKYSTALKFRTNCIFKPKETRILNFIFSAISCLVVLIMGCDTFQLFI